MKFFNSLFLMCLVSGASVASVVEFQGTPQTIQASGKNVAVYPELKLNTGDATQNLKLTGFGIREKSFAFIKFNVYLAASYVDTAVSLSASNPLEGIKTAKGRVIILNMLRGMTVEEIRSAFEEALDKNSVDLNSTAVQSIFSKFSGNLNAGDKILLASYPAGNSLETLVIELPGKSMKEQANFLGLDFWKIWFGEPVDDLMSNLKTKLVGKGE